ncbi:MAG: acyl-CoA dehydrogenase family protein [Chloroflexota bacterium]
MAYNVGAVEDGFKTTVSLVLNSSRLMNAVACAGIMRRTLIEAGQYACHRTAFGNTIANFPMVQETVVDIMAENYAATASSFYIAHLVDKIETGRASEQDEQSYRMLVNVNKYITSIAGTDVVHKGIEILGGNGAIESFSILPRLYRDMIVLESWEGTHNVLAVQVLRDCQKYSVHEGFFADLSAQLDAISHHRLSTQADATKQALSRLQKMLARLSKHDDLAFAQAHARRFIHLAGRLAQATLMLTETQWELDRELSTYKPEILTHFINQHLTPDYDPLDDVDYTERLAYLMTAL